MKIEHVLFPSVFFKIADPCVGRLFSVCSHDPFFETNKSRILENRSCERAFTQLDHAYVLEKNERCDSLNFRPIVSNDWT